MEINILNIIKPLLIQLWWILPLLFLVALLKSAWFKGVLGEFIINYLLKNKLDQQEYTLIKNVTLATSTGSTQIDHLLLSPYGLFVIETKNMKVWIFGQERQKQWTQQIYKHRTKFQNPLHQNYKHIRVLQDYLQLHDSQIHSLVVFTGDCVLKTEMPNNVIKVQNLLRFIKSNITQILTREEIKHILQIIESRRMKEGFKTNQQHIRYLKNKHRDLN
jgi:restriction system protein